MKKPTPAVTTALILVVGLLLAGVWWLALREPPLPEGLVQANGRIEGDHYTVASKFAGKVVERLVSEGDSVTRDQVMARLDCAQTRARVDEAQAAVASVAAQLQAARVGLETLRQQVPLQVASAQAAVTHAEAALAAAQARADQADRDARRFQTLLANHSVDKETTELKVLAARVARADVITAQAAVTQAKKRLAEVELGWQQIKSREQEVAALEAQLNQARASLAEAQSVLDDFTIRAPANGMVTTRIVDEGEVVAAGSPLFDIVDLDRLYLKVYIPEKQIGKVRLGLPARIHTDAFPDEAFPATVRYIASQAEFTPKEVQTPDERVKLVYAVKLYLDENPDHRLTPGLPADAVIRWREGTPWAKPRW